MPAAGPRSASPRPTAQVLEESGVAPASYPTVNRRLRVYARDSWRQRISAACAAHTSLGKRNRRRTPPHDPRQGRS